MPELKAYVRFSFRTRMVQTMLLGNKLQYCLSTIRLKLGRKKKYLCHNFSKIRCRFGQSQFQDILQILKIKSGCEWIIKAPIQSSYISISVKDWPGNFSTCWEFFIADTGLSCEESPIVKLQELSTINWQQKQDTDPDIGRLKMKTESDCVIFWKFTTRESWNSQRLK